MIKLSRQTEILNQLAQNLHNDADLGYNIALYKFTHHPEFNTIENYFEFELEGDVINRGASEEFSWNNYLLVKEQRNLMKQHTGGEWKHLRSRWTLTVRQPLNLSIPKLSFGSV